MKDHQTQSNSPALNKLPADWSWNSIGNFISEFIGGCSPTKKDYTKSGFLVLNKGNIKPHGEIHFGSDRKFVSFDYASEYPDRKINYSDLVVTLRDLSQKADFLGLIGVYRESEDALLTQGAYLIRCGQGLDPRYLVHFSNSLSYRDHVKRSKHGSTQVHLRNGDFLGIPIPIPPLLEQQRIVAEIEKQFTRLDVGLAALWRAQANLKRYRAAVLEAAFEGRLVPTEAKLAGVGNRKASFESAEALLARILTERRQKWQGRGQFKEPASPDTTELVRLPKGWTWTNIEQLREFSLYGPRFSSEDYAEDGYIVLRTTDISESGKVNVDKAPRLRLSKDQFDRYRAIRGDLLVTRTGSLGTLAIFDDEVEAIPGAYLIQFRLATEPVTTRYLFYFLKSPTGQSYLTGKGAGIGRPNLNAPTIEALPVPLPPPDEQARIVAEVERRLSVVEELEAVLSANLQRASRLRQSILQDAFSGKLTLPQSRC